MAGMMDIRRAVMSARTDYEPSVEKTASGALVTVTDALAKPAISLVANFQPVQSGTGTPSPENIRSITGWTGLTTYVSPTAQQSDATAYPATWQAAGTIYGGYVDLVTGEVWGTHGIATMTWGNYVSTAVLGENTRRLFYFTGTVSSTTGDGKYCSVAPWRYSYGHDSLHFYVANGYASVFLPNDTDDALTFEVVMPLTDPFLAATLAPQKITMLPGTNYIWSDANGEIELTYLAETGGES